MNILITGIHTGLGKALATQALDEGHQVLAMGRVCPAELVGHERLGFVTIDLLEHERIPDATRRLLGELTRLDLAILNAGMLGQIKDLADTGLDELRRVMDLNVWANKAILDVLTDGTVQVGQILAISSGAAFNGSGGWGAYCISKSALNLLVRVCSHEHPQIHMCTVAPGLVDTPMLEKVFDVQDDPRWDAQARIRLARDEGRIITADRAARGLLSSLHLLRREPSGSFVDLRTISGWWQCTSRA